MDSISQRLSQAEDDLSNAAITGGDALSQFYDSLNTLFADVEHALSNEDIDDETMLSWSESALRLKLLNEHLLQIEELSSSIQEEMKTAFADVTVHGARHASTSSQPQHKQKDQPKTRVSSTEVMPAYRGSPYIEKAYFWLLDNLHNPYPSKQTRNDLSKSTGVSRDLIDSWFISVRQRIGWTALRKQRYSNKRADIVAAATHFFHSETARRPHYLTSAEEMAFVIIETSAKDLYGGRFLDGGISIANTKPDLHRRKKRTNRNPYPSPHQSSDEVEFDPLMPEGSLSNTFSGASEDRWSRKRGASPSASVTCTPDQRATKRMRLSSSSPGAGNFLPSPSPSEPDQQSVCEVEGNTQAAFYESRTRKRRLSDASDRGAPKRHCIATTGVLPLTDSQPVLPKDSEIFEDWFQRNPTLPVDIPGTDLAVEVYTYQAPRSATPPSSPPPLTSSSTTFRPTITTRAGDLMFHDCPDITTQSLDYSHLFPTFENTPVQNLGLVNSQSQWEQSHIPSVASLTPADLLASVESMNSINPDELTYNDYSDWFPDSQKHLSSTHLPLSITDSDLSSLGFIHTPLQTSLENHPHLLPSSELSRELLQKRLEELIAEASMIQQELGVAA